MANEKKLDIKDIPILSPVAAKVLQLQEENFDISFKELGNIILLDPALTAKILKVSNSALYARQREVTNLQQALTLLGFKTIKSLVLLVCASNMYGKTKTKIKVQSDALKSKTSEMNMWRHLVLTAFVARDLAVKLQYKQFKEEIFIAGLLHDIGRIVFFVKDQEGYESYLDMISKEPGMDILAIEESVFGYNHAGVGKTVLEKWNFPDELIDVVFQHHSVNIDSPYKKMILIVALANLYSKILVDEPLLSCEEQNKGEYNNLLSISPEIDEYFSGPFMDDIKKDELYNLSSDML